MVILNPVTESQRDAIQKILRGLHIRTRTFPSYGGFVEVYADGLSWKAFPDLFSAKVIANVRKKQGYRVRIIKVKGKGKNAKTGYAVFRSLTRTKGRMTPNRIKEALTKGIYAEELARKKGITDKAKEPTPESLLSVLSPLSPKGTITISTKIQRKKKKATKKKEKKEKEESKKTTKKRGRKKTTKKKEKEEKEKMDKKRQEIKKIIKKKEQSVSDILPPPEPSSLKIPTEIDLSSVDNAFNDAFAKI